MRTAVETTVAFLILAAIIVYAYAPFIMTTLA
jgi:hypothetical protein